jgi:hypothetical protein
MLNKIKELFRADKRSEVGVDCLVMQKWRLVHHKDESGLPVNLPKPDNEIASKIIFENNDFFKIWRDPITRDTIIECRNKPRDLFIWGISFEPFSA